MALEQNIRDGLDRCADAIIDGSDPDIDLTGAFFFLTESAEAMEYLTIEVEIRSKKQYTLREANTAYYPYTIRGAAIYVVRCPFGTAEGKLDEIPDDWPLFIVGPYQSGFDRLEQRNDAETVADILEVQRERQAKEQESARIRAEALGQAKAIKDYLYERAGDPDTRDDLYSLKHCTINNLDLGDKYSFVEIAYACKRLGLDVKDVIQEALS